MSTLRGVFLAFVVTTATAVILYLMGRSPLSESGQILWWVGATGSAEGSQQISDWYSASHFIHGILFFGILYLFRRKLSIGTRFLIATIVEAGWEILENSPLIIDRYREATIAFGYSGDSIINSICDIVFMMLGFVVARYVPWWLSLLLIIILEVYVGYMIRDNLTLNVLMLVYPIEAVKIWQAGG